MPTQIPRLPWRFGGYLLNMLAFALGIAAAYFMTIQSLRLDLAAKAESDVVSTLDRKLTSFEVFLREGVVSRDQFYQFSRDVETRLARIEHMLTTQTGENLDKP